MSATTVRLSEILPPDKNSFNLVRLAAALAVMISHAFLLPTGTYLAEPLAVFTSFTLGQHAVNAFFVLSGLMLSSSLEHRPNIVRYAWARALRIYPALLAFGIVFAWLAGPFLTSASIREYFSNVHTWTYPFAVLVQFARAAPPPQIFTDALLAGAVNNPLWTIKYELVAYVALAFLAASGMLKRSWTVPTVCLLSLVALTVTASESQGVDAWPFQLGRYAFCFSLGMLAHQYRQTLRLSPWHLLLSALAAAVLFNTPFRIAGMIVFVAHFSLVAGSWQYEPLGAFSRRVDLSYGTYIYGWPIQQALVTTFAGISSVTLIGLSVPIVLLFAYLSWRLIESPALGLKNLIGPRQIDALQKVPCTGRRAVAEPVGEMAAPMRQGYTQPKKLVHSSSANRT